MENSFPPFSYTLDRVFHILFQPLLTWIEDSLYHLWNSMCIRIKAQNCLPRKNTLSVCTYIFCGNGRFNRCVRPPLSQMRSFLRQTSLFTPSRISFKQVFLWHKHLFGSQIFSLFRYHLFISDCFQQNTIIIKQHVFITLLRISTKITNEQCKQIK